MLSQFFQRIVVPPQFLFTGNQPVHGRVAIAAQINGGNQLVVSKRLFEPLVSVA